jgi:hypothetical protein
MRFFIDLATNQLIPAANESGARGTAETPFIVSAGIDTPVEIQFVDRDTPDALQTPRALATGTQVEWRLKLVEKFTGAVVASVLTFTEPATDADFYVGRLLTTTAPILAELNDDDSDEDNDVTSFALAGEITYLLPTKTIPNRTQHVYLTVTNYYSHNGDAVPLDPSPVIGTQRGSLALGSGVSSAVVTFDDLFSDTNWTLLSAAIRHIGGSPVAISAGTITAKAVDGFTIKLSAATDDTSYILDWVAASIPVTFAIDGDMIRSTYDPQNVGYISGNIGDLSAGGGHLSMDGGPGASSVGGSVLTYGGVTAPGGNLFLYDGGGDVNTRGTGLIGLGERGTRTTFTGSATADRAIALPDADGTVLLSSLATLTPGAAPGSPVEGQIYANSTDHHIYFYNGTTWKQLDN